MEEAYFDLGTRARAITTTSAEAQRWFDRALVWAYAFNHEEAIRCFENAAGADPGCAILPWANGPEPRAPTRVGNVNHDESHCALGAP